MQSTGGNVYGELSQNDHIQRSSMVQVMVRSDWNRLAAGTNFFAAVSTGGELYLWGRNHCGQLGLNDRTDRLFQSERGVASLFSKVDCGLAHTAAIDASTGKMWTWGANDRGQLGQGDYLYRSLPVQFAGSVVWSTVACGNEFTMAIDTSNRLFSWGHNDCGQLGIGLNGGVGVVRQSPVQIAGSWTSVACGFSHALAINSAGQLFAWGFNGFGGVGDSTTTSRSTPVQIPGSWSNISCGYHFSIGKRI